MSIQKISLKMDFSVPCCDIQHIFVFVALLNNTLSYQNYQFEISWSWENGILQHHCSHNAKANSKDNSENALLCSLLRQSADFFFVALQGNTLSSQNFQYEIS